MTGHAPVSLPSALACRGPAPPNATSATPRGSTPRATVRSEPATVTNDSASSVVGTERTDGLVIMDRHLACQLVLREVRGLPPGRVLPWLSDRLLNRSLVAVLDVPAETAHARIVARGEDDEPLDFLRATRSAYLQSAASRNWTVVDATGPTREVLARIRLGAVRRGA